MGGGQFGTALSAVQTVHHAGRPVHALVPEGRPGLEGSRVAAWELRQAGVPHAVVTDAAAPGCIAARRGAGGARGRRPGRANGDVVATAGAYPLALACAAAGIPFLVCAATTAVDLATGRGRRRDHRGGPADARPPGGGHARRARGHPGPQPAPGPRAGRARDRDRDRDRRAPGPVRSRDRVGRGDGVGEAVGRSPGSPPCSPGGERRDERRATHGRPATAEDARPSATPVDVAALRNPPREAGA